MGNNLAPQTAPASLTSLLPHFRFFHSEADEKPQQGRQPSDEKHGTPSPAGKDEVETNRREKIAEGVSLLQQPREKPAQPGRNLFHSKRCAYAPLSAHADAEQGAQHQEGSETMREAREHFDHGVE